MADLKNVIYLSNEDYATLVSTGTVTVGGDTLIYDETNNVYVTPEETASSTNDGLMSAADKAKLDGITPGADVDTNQTVKVDSTVFGVNDAIDIVGAGTVAVTADAEHKKITITGSAHPTDHNQTVKGNGTPFGADAAINIVGGGAATVTADTTNNKITISTPSDTNQTVKVGSTTFGANDVVDFVAGTNITSIDADTSAKTITINAKDTTYDDATTSASGLMSASDKIKLNDIASGAEVNVQADWNVTDSSSDAFIKNKPTIPTDTNQKVKVGSVTFGSNDVVNFEGSGIVSVTGDVTNDKITISASHQSIKTLDTTATTAQSTNASETIAGSGKITLHKVSKTGLYSDLRELPTLGTAASKNVGTASGQIPVLDSNGKLADNVIPTLAITDTYEASSQTAMLQLSAQKGDICIRSDLNKSFILSAEPASDLTHWKELKTPTDAVLSVNGETGAVTLTADDISDTNQAHKFIIELEDNSTTTAGTWLAKTNAITSLEDGQMFVYKITKAGASTTTLNITANGTALGAKTVYRVGTTKLTTQYAVGHYLLLVYNSLNTCFRVVNDSDANSDTKVRQYQSGSDAAGSGTKYPVLTRYALTNKSGSYDANYARFHTDVTVDTSNGNLDAVSLSESGVSLSEKYALNEFATEPEIVALFTQSYIIAANIINGSCTGASSIAQDGNAEVTIVPKSGGYTKPTSVSVTNASSSYSQTTGVITLSQPTGNVWIDATCPMPLPTKGQIIKLTMKDGTTHNFRVLSISGSTAKLVDITEQSGALAYNTSSRTVGYSDGNSYQNYKDSAIDTWCNSTYKNKLSTSVRSAIVSTYRIINAYKMGDYTKGQLSSYDFKVYARPQSQSTVSDEYTYRSVGTYSVGNRDCFALDIDDIKQYFGWTSTSNIYGDTIYDVFGNGRITWLASVSADYSTSAMSMSHDGSSTYFDTWGATQSVSANGCQVQPAFRVDLSQVTYTF